MGQKMSLATPMRTRKDSDEDTNDTGVEEDQDLSDRK